MISSASSIRIAGPVQGVGEKQQFERRALAERVVRFLQLVADLAAHEGSKKRPKIPAKKKTATRSILVLPA